MQTILNLFYGASGVAALYYGAEFLVRGGVRIAERCRISPLVIGSRSSPSPPARRNCGQRRRRHRGQRRHQPRQRGRLEYLQYRADPRTLRRHHPAPGQHASVPIRRAGHAAGRRHADHILPDRARHQPHPRRNLFRGDHPLYGLERAAGEARSGRQHRRR